MLTPIVKELKKLLYLTVETPSISGSLVQSVGLLNVEAKGCKKDWIWLTCKGHHNVDPNVPIGLKQLGGTKRRSRRNLETQNLI